MPICSTASRRSGSESRRSDFVQSQFDSVPYRLTSDCDDVQKKTSDFLYVQKVIIKNKMLCSDCVDWLSDSRTSIFVVVCSLDESG